MAKTVNCKELGGFVDCDYAIVVPDGDEEQLVEATVQHASKHHPEIVTMPAEAMQYIRTQIKDLKRQAHFDDAATRE